MIQMILFLVSIPCSVEALETIGILDACSRYAVAMGFVRTTLMKIYFHNTSPGPVNPRGPGNLAILDVDRYDVFDGPGG